MTDPISARLRNAKSDECCNHIMCDEAADHIDAQAATIKALVDALEVIGNRKVHSDVFPKIARATLAAAKEPT